MDFAKYRLSIQLYNIYNGSSMDDDWQDINFNARSKMFHINDYSKIMVEKTSYQTD